MAMTKSYYTVNGQIEGEATNGVRTEYLPDALGSVTATTNESGVVQNTYRFKPYGDVLAKTGVAADPKFQWNGQWGYRRSSIGELYVRARTYSTSSSVWLTKDEYWPHENAYSYSNNPITQIDLFGLFKIDSDCMTCGAGRNNYSELLQLAMQRLCKDVDGAFDCIDKCAIDYLGTVLQIGCIKKFCRTGTVNCGNEKNECGTSTKVKCPAPCCTTETFGIPEVCGAVYCVQDTILGRPTGIFYNKDNTINICCLCNADYIAGVCKCPFGGDIISAGLGSGAITPGGGSLDLPDPFDVLFHELAHLCGPGCTPHKGRWNKRAFELFSNCVQDCV